MVRHRNMTYKIITTQKWTPTSVKYDSKPKNACLYQQKHVSLHRQSPTLSKCWWFPLFPQCRTLFFRLFPFFRPPFAYFLRSICIKLRGFHFFYALHSIRLYFAYSFSLPFILGKHRTHHQVIRFEQHFHIKRREINTSYLFSFMPHGLTHYRHRHIIMIGHSGPCVTPWMDKK